MVYEQDILRDPGNIKPWLIYIDYKHQHGTLLEQAFVSCLSHFALQEMLTYDIGARAGLCAATTIVQTMEIGVFITARYGVQLLIETSVPRFAGEASPEHESCNSCRGIHQSQCSV